jgi:N-acetylglucosamine-6-phosphate deacetylase
MLHGLSTIAAACDACADVASRVIGIHLEGPFISDRDGYRGAHPAASTRDPDWNLFEKLQQASGGRIVLMTLAPERTGSIEYIRRATAAGVVIALGHTSADLATLNAATEAGALLSTHLGNGIASELPRHPNPIWIQAASPVLFASLIADGHHLDPATLRVLVRAKGIARTILISDASPLAGVPPGIYGDWAVDPDGRIVVADTPYLAGSNHGFEVGLQNLMAASGCTLKQAIGAVTSNPARLLGKPVPRLAAGNAADLVVFKCPRPDAFALERVCVRGRWELEASSKGEGWTGVTKTGA